MDALSYFLCSVYAVFSKNVLVLLTLYREAYAGVIGLVLIELVVLAGQYCIQDNTGQRTYCQSGQADGDLADVECDSACIKAGTTSPYSLYNENLASFTTGDLYDHHDAEGFINLFGLSLKVRAMKLQENEKKLGN